MNERDVKTNYGPPGLALLRHAGWLDNCQRSFLQSTSTLNVILATTVPPEHEEAGLPTCSHLGDCVADETLLFKRQNERPEDHRTLIIITSPIRNVRWTQLALRTLSATPNL